MRSVQRANRGEIGELAIGFVGSATLGILPRVLELFRRRFPQIQLSVHELTTSQQIACLGTRRIRIGFLRPPISDPDIEAETIAREPWVVAMPREHRLHARAAIALQDLAVQMQTVVTLVKARFGVALVPRSVGKLGDREVLFKGIRGSPMLEMAMAWRRDEQSAVLQSFVSAVRAAFGPTQGTAYHSAARRGR